MGSNPNKSKTQSGFLVVGLCVFCVDSVISVAQVKIRVCSFVHMECSLFPKEKWDCSIQCKIATYQILVFIYRFRAYTSVNENNSSHVYLGSFGKNSEMGKLTN